MTSTRTWGSPALMREATARPAVPPPTTICRRRQSLSICATRQGNGRFGGTSTYEVVGFGTVSGNRIAFEAGCMEQTNQAGYHQRQCPYSHRAVGAGLERR